MTRIYSYTLKLSAFLLRGRGGARFRGHWIYTIQIGWYFRNQIVFTIWIEINPIYV